MMDLVFNLTLLIAMSVLSGFISKRFPKENRYAPWIQGLLFGTSAIIGMFNPHVLQPGLFFDGRSIMVSLGTLFHGPIAGIVSGLMIGFYRIYQGGDGVLPGILVILSSFGIGLFGFFHLKSRKGIPSTDELFLFGFIVHLAMLAAMMTLPKAILWQVLTNMTLPILIMFPMATVLTGKVLSEQEFAARYLRDLKISRKNLDITLKSIGDAVISTDIKSNITLMNPMAEALTGWPLKDALGKPLEEIFNIINADSREHVENPAKKVLATGKIEGLATPTLLIARDGREIQISDSAAPISEKDATLTGVVLVFRDVSKEYSVIEKLKASEEDYRNLFEKHSAIKVIIDPKTGFIVNANEAALAYYGWSKETLKKRPIQDVDTRPKEEIAKIIRKVEAGEQVHFEAQHRKADGSIRDVAVSSSPIRVNGKNHLDCIVHDISDRKRLEIQLLQSQKMKIIGNLAGGIAHDFNNMLGIILGHGELLEETLGSGHPALQDVHAIQKAARHSADLTKQLLAFSRQESIAPKVLDLNINIENMLKMLRRLIGEDIRLEWHPAKDLWPVKMDPGQMDQILTNLTINAKDAISGLGCLTIETANIIIEQNDFGTPKELIPGNYVRLTVSDDGCGIPKENISALFEPFFTTKLQGKGTGLGLPMVYGIVQQNGGFIHVNSEPGKGTRFQVYLPRTTESLTLSAPVEKESIPASKEGILVVEDEPALLKLTTRMLEHLGYTVFPTNKPKESLGIAQTHGEEIHLLLTDVIMPEMNGREVAQGLAHFPHIRCLFMSGYTADVITHHGVLEANMNFIQKPFSMKEISSKVREILSPDPKEKAEDFPFSPKPPPSSNTSES